MGYEMNKLSSILGLWFLGGAVACAIVYTVNTIVWTTYYSGTAAGVAMANIAFYFTIASVICMILGVLLVLVLGRNPKANPQTRLPVIIIVFLTFILIAIAYAIPEFF